MVNNGMNCGYRTRNIKSVARSVQLKYLMEVVKPDVPVIIADSVYVYHDTILGIMHYLLQMQDKIVRTKSGNNLVIILTPETPVVKKPEDHITVNDRIGSGLSSSGEPKKGELLKLQDKSLKHAEVIKQIKSGEMPNAQNRAISSRFYLILDDAELCPKHALDNARHVIDVGQSTISYAALAVICKSCFEMHSH